MTPYPLHLLEQAIARFRREHGLSYLRRLAGAEEPELPHRARTFLASERALALVEEAAGQSEHGPDAYAALSAHLARAVLEHHYACARTLSEELLAREVTVEGETRALGQLLDLWRGASSHAQRARTLRDMAPALESFAAALLRLSARADGEVAERLAHLRAPRHPDAGPEGGSQPLARAWLADTEELTREALAFARRTLHAEGQGGFDALWVALGQPFAGLFPRDGRLRRLAADWEPLGLRRLLASRARAAPEHPGPLVGAHVVVLAAPEDVRVSAASRELGLASEIAGAEAVGRAVGHVHASEALPLGLRFAPVATVARSLGSLAVQRLCAPLFLRRVRGLSTRESDTLARAAACFFLLDSRLLAAAVLARPLHDAQALDELASLAERALLGPVPRGVGAALVLRASPGGAFRGKVHGPALSWALRERFDEDWFLNPRVGEPLRGAAARAGALSIEAWADELGTDCARGIARLAELF